MTHSTRIHSYRQPTGKSYIALVANRVYRVRPSARAVAAPDEEAPVLASPVHEASLNPDAGKRLVLDSHLFAVAKVFTDVLVRGSAHARRGPVTTLDTAVQVERARKAVRVHGDRLVELRAGGRLAFSAPEPFTSFPLRWDHSYGGRDKHAEQKLYGPKAPKLGAPRDPGVASLGVLTYARNAAGRGYFIDLDRDRIAGSKAPNLEDPTDPVTPDRLLSKDMLDWLDRPAAACYEPIDHFTFPRAQFLIPPESSPPSRPVYELSVGALLKEDLGRVPDILKPPDPRLYNCAPAGLAVGRLYGGERVKLWNLHPDHELLELDLPGERPKLIVEPPGVAARELEPLLQTVLIEPDRDRLTLTWAGTLEVAMPYPEEVTREMRHAAVWGRG